MGEKYNTFLKMHEESDYPTELHGRLQALDESLAQVESIFKPLHACSLIDLHSEISSLDKAKLELGGVYAINTLFWVYLKTQGEDAASHGIKSELSRIQATMQRVNELEEATKAPKVDKGAAKRFIRSALWEDAHKQAGSENMDNENNKEKRKHSEDSNPHKKKKKKKKKHGTNAAE